MGPVYDTLTGVLFCHTRALTVDDDVRGKGMSNCVEAREMARGPGLSDLALGCEIQLARTCVTVCVCVCVCVCE